MSYSLKSCTRGDSDLSLLDFLSELLDFLFDFWFENAGDIILGESFGDFGGNPGRLDLRPF